ncbi:hypothetical protein CH333_10075 [candidate division WOR-3 bacterium JGI_Cruoil_03_44_89]|uniref:AAA+ ATPase domain-containing protein n=1 Tax=candidate division WOR-3 bacterium JGI_Cruoil_03_44_89 TaxID=1973748 RepID=A0A235BNE3_UNCW3|nr:MAG: hypothetical protein CH333_10075 [candidate division WOR-3 bacterium JGI_Cruoil_03_44_89]
MNIFLTGNTGVGKSTAISKFLGKTNFSYGGFETKLRANQVVLRDLISNETEVVAERFGPNWKVMKEGFEGLGKLSIERALAERDIVVMDELGRFELDCREFQKSVFSALDRGSQIDLSDGSREACGYPGRKIILGVLKNESNPFLDRIRSLKEIVIVKVTEENREFTPELIEEKIRSSDNLPPCL